MPKTILVVDDSPIERQRLKSLLERSGFQVVVAGDGGEAIEAVRRGKPDAILMDVNMPGMDGFAATRTLKVDDATKDIPIVIVSVRGQKADKAWGQMLGARGHVVKPYTDQEMLDQVHAL